MHTIILGPYKYLLKSTIPTLSSAQKDEVLARILAFNHSDFDVGLIDNVVKYHQSFIGREVWAQMALSIIFPYLSCGDQAVLLSLSKLKASLFVVWTLFIHFLYIFQIAYCEYYDPLKKVEWTRICKDFVDNVCHPDLKLRKQSVHLMLHLVQCMEELCQQPDCYQVHLCVHAI